MEHRGVSPMDLLDSLNDSGEQPIDKTQVYRWIRGNLPMPATMVRIAAALSVLDIETGEPAPEALLRHPNEDWIARKLQGRSPDEVERIKQMIDLAFPDKTGTNG